LHCLLTRPDGRHENFEGEETLVEFLVGSQLLPEEHLLQVFEGHLYRIGDHTITVARDCSALQLVKVEYAVTVHHSPKSLPLQFIKAYVRCSSATLSHRTRTQARSRLDLQ
jgi:hypothetical protein